MRERKMRNTFITHLGLPSLRGVPGSRALGPARQTTTGNPHPAPPPPAAAINDGIDKTTNSRSSTTMETETT